MSEAASRPNGGNPTGGGPEGLGGRKGNGRSALSLVPKTDAKQTAKEFKSDQEVRWCPGCGDYVILAAVQSFLPELGVRRENICFVSGIGCSSRFPYYLDTYGMHSIHGRAPAIATGLAASRPDLSVWVVTGDGDALSIGGNHLIHALRRNVNIKILLFNNRIYGLTKGQYSPTSELGKITKSTPIGSADWPFNPISLALGAEASFVARTIDSDRKHLTSVLRAAAHHPGSAFVEIYQNCNIFNDGAFEILKDPTSRDEALIRLEHGQPITFGKRSAPKHEQGGKRSAPKHERSGVDGSAGGAGEVEGFGENCVVKEPRGFGLQVTRTADVDPSEIIVHDETVARPSYAFSLSRLPNDDLTNTPIGVLRAVVRPNYDEIVRDQVAAAREAAADPDQELASLLHGGDTWTIL